VACKKTLTPEEAVDTSLGFSQREARGGDLGALLALDRLCFGDRAWSARAWWAALSSPGWTTTVIVRELRVVAARVLVPAAPISTLASLAVHPGWRRAGLGRALLRGAIERARRVGACWIALEVDAANSGAVGLYRREGFGTTRRFREEGIWRLEMVRRLGAASGR
jgi:ribosomal-protein-alanine N-acetyltransferase